MDYKIKLISSVKLKGEVNSIPYQIEEGVEMAVQSQSIDKSKWFVYIPSIEKFDYIEKYNFDLLINNYIFYPRFYGEFQLPVISDNIHTFTYITPSGYVQWATKNDVSALQSYSNAQRICSDEPRFR